MANQQANSFSHQQSSSSSPSSESPAVTTSLHLSPSSLTSSSSINPPVHPSPSINTGTLNTHSHLSPSSSPCTHVPVPPPLVTLAPSSTPNLYTPFPAPYSSISSLTHQLLTPSSISPRLNNPLSPTPNVSTLTTFLDTPTPQQLEERFAEACFRGDYSLVQSLIEVGVNVNCVPATSIYYRDGWSPLMMVVSIKKTSIVKHLLKNGAHVNLQDNIGWSALMMASHWGHAEIAKVLIEHGAQMNLQDDDGWSDLMIASHWGHAEIAKVLIELGAEMNLQDNDGWSALMMASGEGHAEIAKVLIEHSAQMNLQDNDGRSALMIASRRGHAEIAKVLIELGAQMNLQDNNGESALIMASRCRHGEIAKVLIEHGADANLESFDGNTALSFAETDEMQDFLTLASIPQLIELLLPIAHKWRDLGKQLGLDEATLDLFQITIEDEESCLQAVMATWSKQIHPHDPTWRGLIRAVESVDTTIGQKINRLCRKCFCISL